MGWRRWRAWWLGCGAVAACWSFAAGASELRVLAPNAVKEAVSAAATAYERASGRKVTIGWTGTEAITQRVSGGEVADVVVNAAQNIDRLATEGRLVAGTRADFARSAIGVAVAASAPRPDVSSVEALRAALLAARSVAVSSGTSGRHMVEMFARMGIAADLKDRLRQPPSGAQIGDLIARGDAEIGFQQVSELLHVRGVQYLGPVPAALQSYTVYAAAVHTQAADRDAALAFLRTLRQPETAAVVGASGMEPQ